MDRLSFIENSLAKGRFKQQCPATATIAFKQLSGRRVRFFWDAVDQAQGYRALYTRNLDYLPIDAIDLGNVKESTVQLEAGVTHAIAIQAYNSSCTGNMSPTLKSLSANSNGPDGEIGVADAEPD